MDTRNFRRTNKEHTVIPVGDKSTPNKSNNKFSNEFTRKFDNEFKFKNELNLMVHNEYDKNLLTTSFDVVGEYNWRPFESYLRETDLNDLFDFSVKSMVTKVDNKIDLPLLLQYADDLNIGRYYNSTRTIYEFRGKKYSVEDKKLQSLLLGAMPTDKLSRNQLIKLIEIKADKWSRGHLLLISNWLNLPLHDTSNLATVVYNMVEGDIAYTLAQLSSPLDVIQTDDIEGITARYKSHSADNIKLKTQLLKGRHVNDIYLKLDQYNQRNDDTLKRIFDQIKSSSGGEANLKQYLGDDLYDSMEAYITESIPRPNRIFYGTVDGIDLEKFKDDIPRTEIELGDMTSTSDTDKSIDEINAQLVMGSWTDFYMHLLNPATMKSVDEKTRGNVDSLIEQILKFKIDPSLTGDFKNLHSFQEGDRSNKDDELLNSMKNVVTLDGVLTVEENNLRKLVIAGLVHKYRNRNKSVKPKNRLNFDSIPFEDPFISESDFESDFEKGADKNDLSFQATNDAFGRADFGDTFDLKDEDESSNVPINESSNIPINESSNIPFRVTPKSAKPASVEVARWIPAKRGKNSHQNVSRISTNLYRTSVSLQNKPVEQFTEDELKILETVNAGLIELNAVKREMTGATPQITNIKKQRAISLIVDKKEDLRSILLGGDLKNISEGELQDIITNLNDEIDTLSTTNI